MWLADYPLVKMSVHANFHLRRSMLILLITVCRVIQQQNIERNIRLQKSRIFFIVQSEIWTWFLTNINSQYGHTRSYQCKYASWNPLVVRLQGNLLIYNNYDLFVVSSMLSHSAFLLTLGILMRTSPITGRTFHRSKLPPFTQNPTVN